MTNQREKTAARLVAATGVRADSWRVALGEVVALVFALHRSEPTEAYLVLLPEGLVQKYDRPEPLMAHFDAVATPISDAEVAALDKSRQGLSAEPEEYKARGCAAARALLAMLYDDQHWAWLHQNDTSLIRQAGRALPVLEQEKLIQHRHLAASFFD